MKTVSAFDDPNIYPQIEFGVNMAYNMRHARTGFAQTLKVLEFDLVLENSWNLKKVPFVLDLSWNFVKSSLKICISLSDLWDAQTNCVKIAKKN